MSLRSFGENRVPRVCEAGFCNLPKASHTTRTLSFSLVTAFLFVLVVFCIRNFYLRKCKFLLLLRHIDIFPKFRKAAPYLLDVATSIGRTLVWMLVTTITTLHIQV